MSEDHSILKGIFVVTSKWHYCHYSNRNLSAEKMQCIAQNKKALENRSLITDHEWRLKIVLCCTTMLCKTTNTVLYATDFLYQSVL